MLSDYFDGVRETLILVSKKQGKTHLCAALTLYYLLVTPDAEVVVAASSRDQPPRGIASAPGVGSRPWTRSPEPIQLRRTPSRSGVGRRSGIKA